MAIQIIANILFENFIVYFLRLSKGVFGLSLYQSNQDHKMHGPIVPITKIKKITKPDKPESWIKSHSNAYVANTNTIYNKSLI